MADTEEPNQFNEDICACGHYKTDHDGWGCLRIACGCPTVWSR